MGKQSFPFFSSLRNENTTKPKSMRKREKNKNKASKENEMSKKLNIKRVSKQL